MDDLYLDNIDEFINDQNKIVTYKWLSLTLGVHVNTAKQMLYHFLEKKRKESSGCPLHATYLITGKCVENGSTCHKVSVVREDKLEAVKAKMDITISVHVYSLQRAELKDSAPLYSTDYDALKENMKNCNKYSAIRCAAAVPISSAELQQRELASVPPAQKEVSKPDLNENTSATSKTSAKQPAGIMGMFASKSTPKSQESSKEVKTEQKDDSSVVETSKTRPTSKTNPMSNFFGKSAQKKSEEKPNKSIKEEKDGASTSSATESKKSQNSPKSGCGIKEEQTKVSKSLKNESEDTCNKTKRPEVLDSDDENMESQQKKRRRIKKPRPDSSDDEVVPDSPPVANVQTPSPKKHSAVSQKEESSKVKRRKRRRVLKSTTFVDEEGDFVTEKGYVSESYSESEESEPNSKVKDSVSLKKSFGKKEDEKKEKSQKKPAVASNKARKQPSIMGFFQKK